MKPSNLKIIIIVYGLFFFFTLTGFSANSSPNNDSVAKPAITHCLKPRPQICTMEFRPVCTKLPDGNEKTYTIACSACADTQVVGHVPQACPKIPE